MEKQSSYTLKVAALLTFVGGFLETYSFVTKGHVFATVITGNIVQLFFNLSHANFGVIPKFLIPIFSFVIGIYASVKIRRELNETPLHWREYVLITEIILTVLIYLLQDEVYNLLTISMISFMSAIQVQTFKKINESVYMSTMCTGNTKRLVENVLNKDWKNVGVFSTIITSFVLGVMSSAFFIEYFNKSAILIILVPFIIAYIFVHKNI